MTVTTGFLLFSNYALATSLANRDVNALHYDGPINKENNQKVFNDFDNATDKPDLLVINSGGGDITQGMALGKWVHEHNLNVEVSVVCASSCANYVFPAANKKFLRKDSVLLWHGSAWQQDWAGSEDIEGFSVIINAMRQQETQFYADLEIDNLFTVYGQHVKALKERFLNYFGYGPQGFDYSVDDMSRFGIKNVILKDGEWNWRHYRADKKSEVTRIQLQDDYRFTLRRFVVDDGATSSMDLR
ncbi:ATP-dependent Clp protease proteolytic subunit [Alteromonas confluentis]|uniref:ATP-dependent Clp protease proteolytic subunit n=1 Tax=Alteromonas confluentis TaxID=1656094 RepID=UPI001112EC43|nr:ATP-dependent Clp protease proteolytic subunit [Alteromonas confluentis]